MRIRLLAIGILAIAEVLSSPLAASAPGTATKGAPSFVPKKTAWGDPDLQATWTSDRVSDAGIPLERPEASGSRQTMTDAEFAKRLQEAKKSDGEYQETVDADGTAGLAAWLERTPFARRTSLIVSPANGRLPPMTPAGQALFKAGRNSWVTGQPIDWVADLDAYDRCIARGIPSAMLPWPNNNGIRIFQSPGFVAFQLEVLGTRVVPLGKVSRWPDGVRTWGGQSIGHWEGATLVIETSGLVAGDSAVGDVAKHAGSPVTGRGGGLVPMSEKATTVERLAMTAAGTLLYQVTYSDPDVYTAPWTAEVEWARDDGYRLYEFACHEGNEVRELVTSSRAQRKKDAGRSAKGG